jgi:hypothetical protein
VNLGDTFSWCPTGIGIEHLWIIISDPAAHGGKCVIINITEAQGGQCAYALVPGQHSYIYKKSEVNFGDAMLTSVAVIQVHLTSGSAIAHDPMDKEIVAEIIRQARATQPKTLQPGFPPFLRKYLP